MLRWQSRDTNRNIKWSVFLSDEGRIIETLDYTIRISSTLTIFLIKIFPFCNTQISLFNSSFKTIDLSENKEHRYLKGTSTVSMLFEHRHVALQKNESLVF